jgi:hypothetical protein
MYEGIENSNMFIVTSVTEIELKKAWKNIKKKYSAFPDSTALSKKNCGMLFLSLRAKSLGRRDPSKHLIPLISGHIHSYDIVIDIVILIQFQSSSTQQPTCSC